MPSKPVLTKEQFEVIFEEVCLVIATTHRGLNHILREIIPKNVGITCCPVTFYRRVDAIPEYVNKYAEARRRQAEYMVEQIIDIADDVSADKYVDEEGREHTNHEAINRSRLRVDARKWHASKLAPKKYGDSTKLEHSGPDGEPLTKVTVEIVNGSQAKGNEGT